MAFEKTARLTKIEYDLETGLTRVAWKVLERDAETGEETWTGAMHRANVPAGEAATEDMIASAMSEMKIIHDRADAAAIETIRTQGATLAAQATARAAAKSNPA